MTQEEKQLLFRDLCGRLPYGVIIQRDNCFCGKVTEKLNSHGLADNETYGTFESLNYKPYLRPMSSMTEEERKYYNAVVQLVQDGEVYEYEVVDWLNEHHFDYRGLIEKGLALEAPPEMYNKEESEKGSEVPIPKTVDEAVKTLAKILSEEDRDYLLENGAISMHHSLGRWIRNEWGLWTGSELKDELMNMNKGLNHPDDMSNYIIEEFIKYWNNKI